MAIAALDDVVLYPEAVGAFSLGTMLIDAANEKAATVFTVPKTGNIDRVRFRTGTVTTGETVDVRLETVDATTGDPTGTLVGTTTNGSQVIADANDNVEFEVTLTVAAAVTRGQQLALVIVLPGVTSGNLNISTMANGIGLPSAYQDLFTGTWAKSSSGNPMVMAVRYDDATYQYVPRGPMSLLTNTNAAFNNGSTPDERGNRFVLPFTARCVGLWAAITKAVNVWDLRLYDASSTLLESVAMDGDLFWSTSGAYQGLFDTSVTLTAGTEYRMSILPTSATSVTNREVQVASTALMNALPGGDGMYLTTRTDAGSWTDTTTSRVLMGLILDGFDDGAGSGGGVGPGRGMPRGMV